MLSSLIKIDTYIILCSFSTYIVLQFLSIQDVYIWCSQPGWYIKMFDRTHFLSEISETAPVYTYFLCTWWGYLCQHPARHTFSLSSSLSSDLWSEGHPHTVSHKMLLFKDDQENNHNKALFFRNNFKIKKPFSSQTVISIVILFYNIKCCAHCPCSV